MRLKLHIVLSFPSSHGLTPALVPPCPVCQARQGRLLGNRSVLNSMHLNKKMWFPACLLLSCIHALTTGERYSMWGQGTREDKNVSCSGSFCSFCMSLVFVGLSPQQDGQLGGITVLFKDCISINREVLEEMCIAASHNGSQ